jgi:hypothetical protein
MNCSYETKTRPRPTLSVRLRILPVLVAAVVSLASALPARPDDGRIATTAELHQMRDAGQYRICLQQIARVLRLTDAGKGYDRYDLLLLRGDCLLHLEDPATAQLAYAAAAKSPVPEQAREARAIAFLLQRSTGMTYSPKGAGEAADGINLASKEGRTKALRALLQDELRANEADFRSAAAAENLVPIQDALPKLRDLYAVERAATGGDAKLRPTLEAIAGRARTLIERELDLTDQSVGALERRAGQTVDVAGGGWWWGRYARRGLHTRDRRRLRDLIDYLQRIEEAVKLGHQLAVSFDGDATVWDPLVARSSKAVRHAQDVLDAE